MRNRVIAYIPCRKGSKGIPNKWRRNIADIPLYMHTFASAREMMNTRRVSEVWLSTDSEYLALAAQSHEFSVHKVDNIPDDQQQETRMVQWMDAFPKEELPNITIVLLQMTSPMRTTRDIEVALDEYAYAEKRYGNGQVALFSGYEVTGLYWRRDVDTMCPRYRLSERPPHKAIEPLVFENGAIYICNAKTLSNRPCSRLSANHVVSYIMPYERSVEIDVPEDIARAERMMRLTNA